jgi:hypothetical protein
LVWLLRFNTQEKYQGHSSSCHHVQPPSLSANVPLFTIIITCSIYVSTPLILRDLRIWTKQPTPRHPIRLINHHPFQPIRRLPFLNPLYKAFKYICWVCAYAAVAVAEPWCLKKPVVGVDVWVQGSGCVVVLDCTFGGDYWVRLGRLGSTEYEVRGSRTAPFKREAGEGKGKVGANHAVIRDHLTTCISEFAQIGITRTNNIAKILYGSTKKVFVICKCHIRDVVCRISLKVELNPVC